MKLIAKTRVLPQYLYQTIYFQTVEKSDEIFFIWVDEIRQFAFDSNTGGFVLNRKVSRTSSFLCFSNIFLHFSSKFPELYLIFCPSVSSSPIFTYFLPLLVVFSFCTFFDIDQSWQISFLEVHLHHKNFIFSCSIQIRTSVKSQMKKIVNKSANCKKNI